jgi:hypothetical protein
MADIRVWNKDFGMASQLYNDVYQAQLAAFGPTDSDTMATAKTLQDFNSGAWQRNALNRP